MGQNAQVLRFYAAGSCRVRRCAILAEEFQVDRPFVFVIRNEQLVLFAGCVRNDSAFIRDSIGDSDRAELSAVLGNALGSRSNAPDEF